MIGTSGVNGPATHSPYAPEPSRWAQLAGPFGRFYNCPAATQDASDKVHLVWRLAAGHELCDNSSLRQHGTCLPPETKAIRMLGIVAVVSLVLGAFMAGGGAFDWEFLFSDGYHDHRWARSLGRDGARGLLMLFGGVLIIVGFIGQVVDTAAKQPEVATSSSAAQDTIASPDEPSLPAVGPSSSSAAIKPGAPTIGKTPTPPTPATTPQTTLPSVTASSGPPASYLPSTTSQPGPQPITIWNPQFFSQDDETLVTLQYRFEVGHHPLADAKYYWMINADQTTEVEYEPESVQREGQLSHLFLAPMASTGLQRSWSTELIYEIDKKRYRASNRLYFMPGRGVQSTPVGSSGR